MTTVFMEHALSLAEQGKGYCAPNPAVGAVVVKNNQIVSEGFHQGAGKPHAEVVALQHLDEATCEGATLYVTLEPCCHWGRTPPCTDLIIAKKIAHVIYGFQDPNPLVAGKGAEKLAQNGIICQLQSLDAVANFYNSYAYWTKTRMPWVIAKIAMSLDGKIATAGGQPILLTGEKAAQLTHQYRQQADGILTSVTTIINDNPQLNARINGNSSAKKIYILDRQLQMPLTAKVIDTAKQIVLFYGVEADVTKVINYQRLNITCVKIDTMENKLDLAAVLAFIGNDGVHNLWIEAGATVLASLVKENLLQQLLIYIAPKIIGNEALSVFQLVDFIKNAKQIAWNHLNPDIVCEVSYERR